MKISFIFFSLMSGLAVALLALMPSIPQAKIGKSFFISNIVLCLMLFAPFLPFLGLEQTTPFLPLSIWQSFFGFAVILSLLLFFFFRKKHAPVPPWVYGGAIAIGVAALLLETIAYLPNTQNFWWTKILIPINFFSSAFLLGATLFAMMLGHWYLVQFDLDKGLLRKVCAIYSFALGLRIVVFALSLYLYWKTPVIDAGAVESLISLNGHGIFFWMRLVMGLFLPLVLAYMIYETARIGANQSCTGLLYIAVVFVFMGEMVSHYIFFLKGIPI